MENETNNSANNITAQGGFNTGRRYTRNGQRIYWTQFADGWVYFDDRDRMVDGWIKRDLGLMSLRATPSARWIVSCYDAGEYQPNCPDDIGRTYRPDLQAPADFEYGAALNI